MTRRTTHGFTLVEALLALAIFATIAVLAYRATAALTDGESRLWAEAQRCRTLGCPQGNLDEDPGTIGRLTEPACDCRSAERGHLLLCVERSGDNEPSPDWRTLRIGPSVDLRTKHIFGAR